MKQLIYILIVNYNSSALVARLISSIHFYQEQPKQIIIINNSPEDREIKKLMNEQVCILESNINLGFGKACNLGLSQIYKNDPMGIVWLINPDTYINENSLPKVEQFFLEHPEISILGTEVYEPSGEIWFGWGRFDKSNGLILSVKESLDYTNNPYLKVDWVTGCSLLINLIHFSQCPYFDPNYFLYYEDVDFCQRYAKQGHLVAVTNKIKIIHEPSSITSKYADLKLTHNIYSYLLSLEKHTQFIILYIRLVRMIVMSILVLPFNFSFARNKLKGINLYLQQRISSIRQKKMFKLLIDGTALRPKPSGIGLYVYHLINELSKLQGSDNFKLHIAYQPSVKNWLKANLSVPPQLATYPNVHCLPIPISLSHRLAIYTPPLLSYFDRYLDSPNIIHSLDHVVYPYSKSQKVMTIHDLTFIKYPHLVNSIVRTYTQRVKECLKWTDLIIAVSESTKQDIINHLGVKPEKIYVTPLGSRYPEETKSLVAQMPSLFPHLKPYILLVSTLEPRKNIINLITAFNLLKQIYKIEHKLILIGQKGWNYKPIFVALENSPWQSDIYHLDYLSDIEVAWFYANADIFVYPSIYEGFGLPVLEAMTLGTPVITSNTSSLPEVAGEAAILIDPQDSQQIADAIFQVISNPQLRQSMIEKGQKRVKLFSWEKTAKATLEAYQSLL